MFCRILRSRRRPPARWHARVQFSTATGRGVLSPFLEKQKFAVVDAGMGTALGERGVDTGSILWSVSGLIEDQGERDTAAVHSDFLKAGADVLLTNSYKVSEELLHRVDWPRCEPTTGPEDVMVPEVSDEHKALATKLLQSSVRLACEERDAFWDNFRAGHQCGDAPRLRPVVAASLGPYGTSIPFSGAEYKGNYGVSEQVLADFHSRRVEALCRGTPAPELLAFETIPDLLETKAIVKMLDELARNPPHGASSAVPPAWICWTCPDEEHVFSGDKLADCAKLAQECDSVEALGVNCVKPWLVQGLLRELKLHTDKPLVVYPNSGEVWHADANAREWKWDKDNAMAAPKNDGSRLSDWVKVWLDEGATLVGGCCRTSAKDIVALRRFLY